MSTFPIRVLMILSPGSQYWPDSWDSPENISSLGLEAVKKAEIFQHDVQGETRILMKQRWPKHRFVVFDIGYADYSAANGHLPEYNRLPVCVVHCGSKGINARLANEGMMKRVNKEVADAHNLHGDDSEPPFEEDHLHGNYPTYLNPRDPSLL